MAALVDTNVLVYRFDHRYAEKQKTARDLLRERLVRGDMRIPFQALIEFVPAVTRAPKGGQPLLSEADAWHEVENFLAIYPILYPTDEVLRTAIRGAALYRLSWFDANLWAYADCFGLDELLSEDFQQGCLYGTVRAINPFL